jgi:hypothetical protein
MKTYFEKYKVSQAWWYTPVIPVLKRLKQEDCQFEANKALTQK